ncbi:hypothetical protein DQ04_04471010 [Trypanosoma grayi]|uniref:hypothetical protein n=1 Tax=Trypanosoma grayi TaxID=71804 RepID=UPI0004F43F36|nr:hypothetical protein DQ04_04471010 [Trypanosoma grayi]KEG09900.1 hypothetical protein DQ04_04471010 [Trypanosoma grayi]
MLGVENSGTFPLRISIRHETDSLMVFDDPLALSPAHFCAIPTTDFIPDWRYLLCQPKRGLELVRSLLNACHKVLTEQFLENSEWKSTVLRSPDMEAKQHTLVGFNYPPSQNQLHVQYIVPPLMPHQFYMYCRGQHFTYNRFFPLSYVEKCLNELAKKDEAPDTQEFLLSLPIDDLIVMLDKKCNASYQREHCAFLSRVEVLQNHFGNWAMDNFEGVYHVPENTGSNKGKLLFKKPSGESFYVDEPSAIAEDKKRLQNYGRPYDEKENPSGGFYSFAKKLVDIKVWS